MAKIINHECVCLVKQNPLAEKPSPKPFYTAGLHSHTHKLMHVLITAHHAHQTHHLFFPPAPTYPGLMSSRVLPALPIPAGSAQSPAHPGWLMTLYWLLWEHCHRQRTGRRSSHPDLLPPAQPNKGKRTGARWTLSETMPVLLSLAEVGDSISGICLPWWARDRSSPLTCHNTGRAENHRGFEAGVFFLNFF